MSDAMDTVININGLDVEFSDQKPTRPGAYRHTHDVESIPVLLDVEMRDGKMICWYGGHRDDVDDVGSLWSAPLVPVTEVEKAYREGVSHGVMLYCREGDDPVDLDREYAQSNARKVVEGVR